MTLKMNKASAVLQGAFLRADQLCLPSSLSCLQKADWSRVGRPVLEAVGEVCGREDGALMKKLVCAVWLKALRGETGEDEEAAWREDPFFPFQNGLPELNRVALLELVKSTASARIFARLLSSLPPSHVCAELERLVRHVRSGPVGEADVRLFLEVWWELWKGGDQRDAGGEDGTEAAFARRFARLAAEPPGPSPQGAKRPKLEAEDLPASPPTADVLHVLLHALKDLKGRVSTAELCRQALSVSLDSLYTTFLTGGAAELPTGEKLRILSKAVGIREESGEKLSPELLREAQRDMRASRTPSRFQPGATKLADAAKIVTDLALVWRSGGFLDACGGSKPSCSAFKLEQSVQRVLAALREADAPDAATQAEKDLKALLESLAFPATESDPEANMRVAAAVIAHRLEDYRHFALLFAGERSWAARGGGALWTDCLEQNRAAFQQLDALVALTSALVGELGGGADVGRCRKLMKVVADIFSALSLADKNAALAAVLRLSSRGFFGGASVPAAVTEAFERELNMAFNCIIQGAAASTQGNLSTAVALVARVAFQNPEATLRSCCQSAVFNKGAFSLMAKILQQLPGLRGHGGRREEARGEEEEEEEEEKMEEEEEDALLCECLLEAIGTKSLSANDKEQLREYLGLLMTPVTAAEGEEERRRSFLTPREVVNVFVLPNLSTRGRRSVDVELSLQLLQTALSVEVEEAASRPHWVLDCSPFPLLYVLAQLHHQTLWCWEQQPEDGAPRWSMDAKELLVSVLTALGRVVGAQVAATPSRWSRALFWLYDKTAALDWTVRFHLKAVWGEHFKNEVPSSLLAVCDLPEQDWLGSDLPPYGPGTGLLAWMECCAASDSLRSTMLTRLSLDRRRPDHVGMFSKGLLVALAQTLPGCSASQWARLLGALRELIGSGRLYVPFSLEYVDYLPLLDLRGFSRDLRLSVLLLRALQLLCGSSCSHWLSPDGWAHVGRLYAQAVREMMSSVRGKLPLPASAAPNVSASSARPETSGDADPSVAAPKTSKDVQLAGSAKESRMEEEEEATVPCQEVLFVLSQLFCHVQHIQVMMPGGQSEPLFLSSLEILSHYEAVMAAFPDSSSPLESDNTRHFFSTITDNLQSADMKAVLRQKIAQLVSSAA